VKNISTEAFEILEIALGEQTVGKRQVFEWFSEFGSGVTSVGKQYR
jgi:hypothetical protein